MSFSRKRMLDRSVQRQFQFRHPNGHGDRRACHEGKTKLSRLAEHRLGLRPGIRKMLIAKHRNGSTAPFEDFHNLLKELKARIEFLPLFISGVLAMFSDEQHGIHRETFATEGQRFPDRGIDLETVFYGKIPAHVLLGDLVRIHRDYLGARHHPLPVWEIALQDAPDDNVGVGVVTVLGHDGSDGLLLRSRIKRTAKSTREKHTPSGPQDGLTRPLDSGASRGHPQGS